MFQGFHVVMVLVGQALDLRPLEAGSGESIFEVRRLGAVKVIVVVEQFVARLPPVGTASASALEGDAPAGHGTRAGPAVAGCVAPRGAGARKRGRARLCHVRRGFVVQLRSFLRFITKASVSKFAKKNKKL